VLKDDGDIREVRATIAEGGLRAVIGEGARA
jgi:hypothetical protein